MATNDGTLLWHYVDRWAQQKPDAEALAFGDTRLTWGELKEQVDRTAKAFLEAGVQKGDRVALLSMARPEFIVTFMAASKIGAIWLGLSPKFTMDELRYIIGHARPTVLIAVGEYSNVDILSAAMTFQQELGCIEKVLSIGEKGGRLEDFQNFVDKERPGDALEQRVAEVSPDDEVLLMYTSGSTGKPKGVLHTHNGIIENVAVQVEHFGFTDQDRALLHFPINHVAADVEIGYATVFAGGTLVLRDRFDPIDSLETIERERVSIIGQVPVMYLMQLQTQKFAEMDWSGVRSFVWGGSAAPRLVLKVLFAVAEQTGAKIMTGYGSTELCGFVTYSKPDDDIETLAESAGRIVPPFEMKIVDEDRNAVPSGTVGEIAVRGPSVMKGYLNNPTMTADVIDDEGWYYTSDLGTMNDEGYLYISGRRSEMYKTGGENVFPREVEGVLETHPAVLFAAVIGVPDELYDEVGYAFIMLKPAQTTNAEELRGYCRNYLANFKIPKQIDVRKQLPLLPNGKVNKVILKQELGLR